MQVNPGLLRTAMSHQRRDDRQIDAAIHEMSCETMSQGSRRDRVGKTRATRGGAHDLADVVHAQPTLADRGPKQRPALAVIEELGEQLGIDGFWYRHRT